MDTISELLVKKIALKEVELWLNQQYLEIDQQIAELEAKDGKKL